MMVSSILPILAFVALRFSPSLAQNRTDEPCNPFPCGANTECRVESGRAICSCQTNYIGSPLFGGCRHECESDNECGFNHTCIDYRCKNPCDNLCGQNTNCKVRNHVAVCSCLPDYFGDPYARCVPECASHADCLPANRACIGIKCVDPCTGTCGINAECRVDNSSSRNPICSCPKGYTGDPFLSCRPQTPDELCNPSLCGTNTECRVESGRAICSCQANYFGNPLSGCKHECESDTQCRFNHTCVDSKCQNQCHNGPCGQNATCEVRNHVAVCRCLPDHFGDPYKGCVPECTRHVDCPFNRVCIGIKCADPCAGGTCGINATCEVRNHSPVCRCLPDYLGNPYTRCYPECTSHAECPANRACIGLKCGDPCAGTCGINAECRVDESSRQAICSCPKGYTGNPFESCTPQTPGGSRVTRRQVNRR